MGGGGGAGRREGWGHVDISDWMSKEEEVEDREKHKNKLDFALVASGHDGVSEIGDVHRDGEIGN